MGRLDPAANRQRWMRRIQRFAQSRLTVAEFCRMENVSVAAFYQWRKKLALQFAEGDCRGSSDGTLGAKAAPLSSNGFVPVRLLPTQAAAIDVQFPNGVTLSLPAGDHEVLKLVLTIVSQLPRSARLDEEGGRC